MSWGRELWQSEKTSTGDLVDGRRVFFEMDLNKTDDQGDAISAHTKKGIEFLDRYAGFVSERSKVENEYARQLKALASKYTPRKKDDDDERFTHRQAFIGVLNELGDLANQHERVAEQFRDEIVAEMVLISKKLRDERKENLDEALRLQNMLDASETTMRKAQKEYSRAHKESEAAQAKYVKANADMNISRAELEKAKNNSIAKTQQAEDAKNNYALQLQRTNEFQRDYFTKLLPAVFEKLRELDESRVNDISRLMAKCVDIERNVMPIVQSCLNGMFEQSKRIDATTDSSIVVQRYKSGYIVPEDYPFEDLSADGSSTGSTGCDQMDYPNGGSSMVNGNGNGSHYGTAGIPTSPGGNTTVVRRAQDRRQSGSGATVNRAQSTKRGKFTNFFKNKNDDYLKEDFSHLPPQQQCKHLEQRIESIQKQIDTKLAQKDGLMKMQTVYRESPKLGDLSQVEAELHRCEVEVASLEAEKAKFQNYHREATTYLNVPINVAITGGACSNSTSPSSTPKSSLRGPPPNRPPPPTTSPSFQETLTSANKAHRNSGGSDLGSVGRSGSEHSIVTGSSQQDNVGKGKSLLTPQSANMNGSGLPLSSSTPRTHLLAYGKGSSRPPSSIDSGFSSKSSSRLAPAAPSDDYDEWVPVDADEHEPEADVKSSASIILGTCRGLYDFAGDGEGMVAMKEGEEMLLLERDAGDGWTKVRKSDKKEGFVPTSYLDCKWYPE